MTKEAHGPGSLRSPVQPVTFSNTLLGIRGNFGFQETFGVFLAG